MNAAATPVPTSRRALLAGAIGGLGALAATAIGRPSVAHAEGEIIHVGDEIVTATSQTLIKNQANGLTVFSAQSSSSGAGVLGVSQTGIGVYGASGTYIGVFGYSDTNDAVYGQTSSGNGVLGGAINGHGIHGKATTGYAGYFDGKVFTNKFYEASEVSTPNAPKANRLRLFARDNGSGKTQLCVRFNTGGVLVIKTQP